MINVAALHALQKAHYLQNRQVNCFAWTTSNGRKVKKCGE